MKLFALVLSLIIYLSLTPKSFASINIALEPTAITIKKGVEFEINVLAETDRDAVAGVEIRLQYDPNLLELVQINGNYKYKVSQQFNISDLEYTTLGEIIISAVQENPALRQPLTGRFATITFLPKAEGPTTISFICQNGTNSSQIILNNRFTNGLDCRALSSPIKTQVTIVDSPILGATVNKKTVSPIAPFTRDLLIILGAFTLGVSFLVLSMRQNI